MGYSNTLFSSSFWKERIDTSQCNPISVPSVYHEMITVLGNIHMEQLEMNSDSRARGCKELKSRRQYGAMEGALLLTCSVNLSRFVKLPKPDNTNTDNTSTLFKE